MSTLVIVVLGLAAFFIILRYLLLKPLLASFRQRAIIALNLPSYNGASDYSKTGYCPIHNELTDAPLAIEGELPADLSGLYLRNGTNSPFDRNDSRRHMFNGAGMIHQVRIENGKASYSNQYTQTPRYLAEKDAGRELYIEFGDVAGGGKPAMGKIALSAIERKTGLAPNMEDTVNSGATTAIQYHHGELYALQETSFPFKSCRKHSTGYFCPVFTGISGNYNRQAIIQWISNCNTIFIVPKLHAIVKTIWMVFFINQVP